MSLVDVQQTAHPTPVVTTNTSRGLESVPQRAYTTSMVATIVSMSPITLTHTARPTSVTTNAPRSLERVPQGGPPTTAAPNNAPRELENAPKTAQLSSVAANTLLTPMIIPRNICPLMSTIVPSPLKRVPYTARPTSEATNAQSSLERDPQRAPPTPMATTNASVPPMKVPRATYPTSVATTDPRPLERVTPTARPTSVATHRALIPQLEEALNKEAKTPKKDTPGISIKPMPPAACPSSAVTMNDQTCSVRVPPRDEASDREVRPAKIPKTQLRKPKKLEKQAGRYPVRVRRAPERLCY
ncbi:extensin-like isoform X1 [Bufo gargarizans]|uniref:extensin-like isoform X1 n=1 Tax=Bufo gargarizans TaxID=30331 RepID=UPI001CF515EA|nr:extensin-like isoform X1 [Bufo gargarizans]